jgi:hypothetical protein
MLGADLKAGLITCSPRINAPHPVGKHASQVRAPFLSPYADCAATALPACRCANATRDGETTQSVAEFFASLGDYPREPVVS